MACPRCGGRTVELGVYSEPNRRRCIAPARRDATPCGWEGDADEEVGGDPPLTPAEKKRRLRQHHTDDLEPTPLEERLLVQRMFDTLRRARRRD